MFIVIVVAHIIFLDGWFTFKVGTDEFTEEELKKIERDAFMIDLIRYILSVISLLILLYQRRFVSTLRHF